MKIKMINITRENETIMRLAYLSFMYVLRSPAVAYPQKNDLVVKQSKELNKIITSGIKCTYISAKTDSFKGERYKK